jgi:hypothetical protein
MDWIELPLEPHHYGVSLDASKMISEPMVRLAQPVHLSCTDTNTVSKWTETRFHMTHITKEFYRVHPKWFLSLWYVWPKPYIHLVSRLTLSSNGLNRASTWALYLGVPSWASKMILSLWYIWHKPCTYLALTQTESPNGPKRDSTWPTSPRSFIGCVQKCFLSLWYVRR